KTGAGRGWGECSVEHEGPGCLDLRVEFGPGLEVGLIAARRICVGPHQHQVAHALTVSRRSDIDPGRSACSRLKPPQEDFTCAPAARTSSTLTAGCCSSPFCRPITQGESTGDPGSC